MPAAPETDSFAQLQDRLIALLGRQGAVARTVVVVPSMTLHPDELRKIPGAVHFEQRLLFCLQLLRRPGTRLVYVTSRPIDREIVDYAIGLVDSLSRQDARERLTLIDCADASPVPLTDKILARPDLASMILSAVDDRSAAYLVTYNSTASERELALRLGMPLFSCDPRLEPLGTKSGGRRLLRAARVPVLDGYEDVCDEQDLVTALTRLKSENPRLGKAVVKLDSSFAGAGNAVFCYESTPVEDLESWITTELRNRLTIGAGDTKENYLDKLRAMKGVVESYLETATARSPSAQLELMPDRTVRILSTHDQLLGGPSGQTFVGCAFPAHESYRSKVQELALLVGSELALAGVIGQCSVDFLADERDDLYALEINLRMGGATAPFMFMQGQVNGRYDDASGNYLTPGGEPRYYVASDRIHDDRFCAFSPRDLVDIAARHHLRYNSETRTGAIYYALGALAEFGKLGVIAIGDSPEHAQACYDDLLAALRAALDAGAARTSRTRRTPVAAPSMWSTVWMSRRRLSNCAIRLVGRLLLLLWNSRHQSHKYPS
jgi:hypothetical protein